MKNTGQEIFEALISQGNKTILPREWHLSARSILVFIQGFQKDFEDRLEKISKVDPKIREYLEKYSSKDIANHLRYLLEIQQDAR